MYCVNVTLLSSPRGKKLNKTVNPLIKREGGRKKKKRKTKGGGGGRGAEIVQWNKTFEKRGKTAGVLKLSSSSKTFSTLVTPFPPKTTTTLCTEIALK